MSPPTAELEGKVVKTWLPKDAYDPGGKAAAELKGALPEAAEALDLALAAAFTSMSLRDRWRDPVVDADLVLTVEALVVRGRTTVRTTLELCTHIVKLILLFFTTDIKLSLTKVGTRSTDQHFLLVSEDTVQPMLRRSDCNYTHLLHFSSCNQRL